VHALKPYKDQGKLRLDYDLDLADIIMREAQPDIIVLAGFMHILSKEFLDRIPPQIPIINLHPALPGAFDGAGAIERAYTAWQMGEISETGVMVHKVIPEVDRGEVVVYQPVPLKEGDSLADLEQRIHAVEHELIVKAIKVLISN
jgi:phosphoribosylglycinamide formyltransferase